MGPLQVCRWIHGPGPPGCRSTKGSCVRGKIWRPRRVRTAQQGRQHPSSCPALEMDSTKPSQQCSQCSAGPLPGGSRGSVDPRSRIPMRWRNAREALCAIMHPPRRLGTGNVSPGGKMPRANGKVGDVQWHCRAASGQCFSLGLWGRTGGRETSEPSRREGEDRSRWLLPESRSSTHVPARTATQNPRVFFFFWHLLFPFPSIPLIFRFPRI